MDKNIFIYSVLIPETDWILVSTVPATGIFTQINRFLFNMIGVNLALIAIAAVMSVILTRILQNERDENAAMKDNLKVGFFLIDKHYSIQGQYSQALEQLFSIVDLKGKNFIALLSGSLTKKEIDTLKDYFTMVLDRSFDQEMLDEINPIRELSYISVETGEEKALSCGFAAVNRGSKDVFILGNIIDITNQKELKTQLAAEEAKRQEDMQFIFEVIQGDPEILSDFIEDMDYHFEQVDAVFEDENMLSHEAVIAIYQGIHAIKSDAVMLGLKTFGGKLHSFETDIKTVLEQEAIFKEDLQRLTEEIRLIKQNRGKLAAAIQKILSFKTTDRQNQGEYVLIESLTKTCDKVSADLDKKVSFVVKEINSKTITHGPRRAMKEVLMQLIRNAVYHGIESGEERQAEGKDETGTVSLSITLKSGRILIKLSDDGKGIDYTKVRTKAEKLGLIPPSVSKADPDALLQVIFAPGFSTAEEEGMHAGRGIGLNLVQDRIKELGGTIHVQSEANKGTVFTIVIPLSDPAVSPRVF
jgi:two-component system chemotaxis sensor kinase CheA